jgi:hypothetical protein|tara:strand:+ start:110 stop:265 length:156 start_codon:yes stop_codon:yes gene_type:complete
MSDNVILCSGDGCEVKDSCNLHLELTDPATQNHYAVPPLNDDGSCDIYEPV